ncbi:hypothetical protein SAMN05444354_117105 [Stigmatella aurantiaca]|uniref:Uncharacterized protein n=1 Tax=Stigmatella aurantiaca TaxID=41 RepID=A0A1H7YP68_STIAU|nr:hypothetical protein SAMN05444354_117105 [Stigmatella aurantiaca]
MGAVADSPCHLSQKSGGFWLRAKSLFRLIGIDGYLTSGAAQNGANLIGKKERSTFFEYSLGQFPHIVPVEFAGHRLT